jgi:hypothetical protein
MFERRLSVRGATVLAVAVTALAGAAAAPAAPLTVIASGLDNPRGLAIDGGAIYVAEAGKGGTGPCGIAAGGDSVCLGLTGAVTRIAQGKQERIVSGLPSVAGPSGLLPPVRTTWPSGRPGSTCCSGSVATWRSAPSSGPRDRCSDSSFA